jgi:hypothetical protein
MKTVQIGGTRRKPRLAFRLLASDIGAFASELATPDERDAGWVERAVDRSLDTSLLSRLLNATHGVSAVRIDALAGEYARERRGRRPAFPSSESQRAGFLSRRPDGRRPA